MSALQARRNLPEDAIRTTDAARAEGCAQSAIGLDGAVMAPTGGNDRELVAAVASGSERDFEVLAAHHVRRLLRIATRIVGEPAEAEDIAQEALIRLWRSAGSIEIGPLGLAPWLNRVTANLALDAIRRRRPVDDAALDQLTVEPGQGVAMAGTERRSAVAAALAELPERQRTALQLFHFEELSLRETAATMEISEEAVESLLSRARRSLKQRLSHAWRDLI